MIIGISMFNTISKLTIRCCIGIFCQDGLHLKKENKFCHKTNYQ